MELLAGRPSGMALGNDMVSHFIYSLEDLRHGSWKRRDVSFHRGSCSGMVINDPSDHSAGLQQKIPRHVDCEINVLSLEEQKREADQKGISILPPPRSKIIFACIWHLSQSWHGVQGAPRVQTNPSCIQCLFYSP